MRKILLEEYPRVVKGTAVVLGICVLALVFGSAEILDLIERLLKVVVPGFE